jgi:hypothetical protein
VGVGDRSGLGDDVGVRSGERAGEWVSECLIHGCPSKQERKREGEVPAGAHLRRRPYADTEELSSVPTHRPRKQGRGATLLAVIGCRVPALRLGHQWESKLGCGVARATDAKRGLAAGWRREQGRPQQ